MVVIAIIKEYSALSRREQYIWEDEFHISLSYSTGTSVQAMITSYYNSVMTLD
jgi:hypothetical protein